MIISAVQVITFQKSTLAKWIKACLQEGFTERNQIRKLHKAGHELDMEGEKGLKMLQQEAEPANRLWPQGVPQEPYEKEKIISNKHN